MKVYHNKINNLVFASVSGKLAIMSIVAFLLSLVPVLVNRSLTSLSLFPSLAPLMDKLVRCLLFTGVNLLILAAVTRIVLPHTAQITHMVCRGLFDPVRGNPLHLREGELLPRIRCKRVGKGIYNLTVSAQQSVTVDTIKAAAPSISATLKHRFRNYAVVSTQQDLALNHVIFRLEDVKIDRSLTFNSQEEMLPRSPTLFRVDKVTTINLTTSGSILAAGKTRSGKTTGIISLIIQALLIGPDDHGSQVVIVDPKQAELSRLPHCVTLDENGEASAILNALKDFAETITRRQSVLNEFSEKRGDAVNWWDVGFHPSFVFIDEYVSCRSIFPKKSKIGDYSLDTFDVLIKRIVTMGAAAGCFAIISIAEASVQEGGLPAMLRSAMSTRILFRPTRSESLLLWDREKLDSLPERAYVPGDAWFSSTDGVHDGVSFVHFPRMKFPIYRELGRLMQQYYGNK